MKYLEKIIEYGLYLLVFLLPIQTRWIIKAGEINNGPFEYGTISLYGTDILLIILLLLFFISKILQPRIKNYDLRIKKYWYIVAGIDLFVFISIFMAPDKLLAIYRYSVFLLAIGLFWMIIEANYKRVKLFYSFLAGIFLQSLLGTWQFLFQSSFAFKWLGLAEHKAETLGTSVVEFIASDGIGERWLRAYGGLDHPNMLGGLLAIGIIFTIFLILEKNIVKISKSEIINSKQIQNSKLKTQKLFDYFLFVTLFILIIALFFTFSRGAWFAVMAGALIILLINIFKKNLWAQKELLILILFSGLLIFALTWRYNELVFTRLSNDTRLEIKSNQERIVSYQEAWQIIKKHPFVGVGIGNYGLAVRNELQPKQQSWYYQPTHNVFLLVWAEIGLFGFMCFVGLLLYILIINFIVFISKPIHDTKYMIQNTYVLNISLILVLPILMFVDHYLWSLHFGLFLFWLIIGLVIRDIKLQSAGKVVE